MKIEIDLNRISDGILVLNVPDVKASTQKAIPAQNPKDKKDFISGLNQYFTPAELIRFIKKYRSRIDNSCLTKVLVNEGYIEPFTNSRCYVPGPKWNINMGKTKILCSSHKSMNGIAVISHYNKNHPVIKTIINNIIEKE